MKKPLGTETNSLQTATILSVSPANDDCLALQRIFENGSDWAAYTKCRWSLIARRTLASALTSLRQLRIRVVLCERELLPGSWLDMLEQIAALPDPPLLIVTSRLADERLWAEALNRGAYDVLAKPFDRTEVVRVISLAWLHSNIRREVPA
ncbi:MAG: response regulator [Bryobacteraceae bacterium]|jgi:DNA-binding NtrC family response regulator